MSLGAATVKERWLARGQLPEVMRRQSQHYQEEAERRLKSLTRAAAFLIWLLTAAFIAWAIFRIFTKVYLNALKAYEPANSSRQEMTLLDRIMPDMRSSTARTYLRR
jgi:hypothetical protein